MRVVFYVRTDDIQAEDALSFEQIVDQLSDQLADLVDAHPLTGILSVGSNFYCHAFDCPSHVGFEECQTIRLE